MIRHTDSERAKRRAGTLFIAAMLAVSLLAWGGVQLAAAANAEHRQVQVVDGDGQRHLLPLGEDASYTFDTSLGTNTVRVSGGEALMESSDCPGHDCVKQGAIDSEAEMIVCMPHKLIVTIVDEEEA